MAETEQPSSGKCSDDNKANTSSEDVNPTIEEKMTLNAKNYEISKLLAPFKNAYTNNTLINITPTSRLYMLETLLSTCAALLIAQLSQVITHVCVASICGESIESYNIWYACIQGIEFIIVGTLLYYCTWLIGPLSATISNENVSRALNTRNCMLIVLASTGGFFVGYTMPNYKIAWHQPLLAFQPLVIAGSLEAMFISCPRALLTRARCNIAVTLATLITSLMFACSIGGGSVAEPTIIIIMAQVVLSLTFVQGLYDQCEENRASSFGLQTNYILSVLGSQLALTALLAYPVPKPVKLPVLIQKPKKTLGGTFCMGAYFGGNKNTDKNMH